MLKITLPLGAGHIVPTLSNGEPDLESYSRSSNTRAALQSAYDAGSFEPYEPIELEPPPPPPNWADFRITLMMNTEFRLWAEGIPADWREDLKGAAILGNAEALQATYSHVARLYPVPAAAAADWQQIADATDIPINFLG